MNSEIPLLSLGDAGVKLIDCVHKTPAGVDQGFPYTAIPQLTEGRIDDDSARRISEQDMLEWNIKCDPQEDDIVLSRRCNPGVTAVVPKEFRGSLGQNLVLLRATDPSLMEPRYLRWVTRGGEWWNEVGRYINVGAVFESLRCADIPEFAIPVPPVAEQQAIAHILGTLDDKIELNRKTNGTLEAMAKALFKSWFVDFDPVRAKAEGRPTGMPSEISDLFPDSFEDSELGEIPSGWSIGTISNSVGEVFDGPHATPKEASDGYVFLGIKVTIQASVRTAARVHPDRSSLSGQRSRAVVAAELRDPAAMRASLRPGDGRSRPAPGTARYPGPVAARWW